MRDALFADDKREQRLALNRKHSEFPEVGDFWDEMFLPIAIVRMVDEHHVAVQRNFRGGKDGRITVTSTDPAPDLMLRADFCAWLRYDTIPDKTWADVSPRRFAPPGEKP